MRNAIHADLQSQVELLIDTICLGFPVGEKNVLGRKNLCEKFLGGKNWGENILGEKICG